MEKLLKKLTLASILQSFAGAYSEYTIAEIMTNDFSTSYHPITVENVPCYMRQNICRMFEKAVHTAFMNVGYKSLCRRNMLRRFDYLSGSLILSLIQAEIYRQLAIFDGAEESYLPMPSISWPMAKVRGYTGTFEIGYEPKLVWHDEPELRNTIWSQAARIVVRQLIGEELQPKYTRYGKVASSIYSRGTSYNGWGVLSDDDE